MKAPSCAFCGQTAAANLVFTDGAAVGMNARLVTSDGERQVIFEYGSDMDGDVCVLAGEVELRPGEFSACDGCGEAMLADGRLRKVRNYLTGETFPTQEI